MRDMEERLPQPVHANSDTTAAPGDLELVRGFVSLHDHAVGDSASLEPSSETLAWWLRATDLVPPDAALTEPDLVWALGIRDALVAAVRRNMGAGRDADADELLTAAAVETGLHPRFDRTTLDPTATGVHGAIGRLLGIAFMAALDGSWHRFRLCADPTCRTVFYDRSKNHSAKWCSMQTCGNRNKVRTFRRRHATTA